MSILCVSLLQQGAPELILVRWMEIDKFTSTCWQIVINYHVNPGSVAPKPEMKDSRMKLSTFPVLLLSINYHLQHKSTQALNLTITFITKIIWKAHTSAGWDLDPEILELNHDPDIQQNVHSIPSQISSKSIQTFSEMLWFILWNLDMSPKVNTENFLG